MESHADVGEGTAQPTTGGLSRTELAKARLEEKRQRLAQQRARMAAGKAHAAGPPSLPRTTSNASRAGSEASSVTSPVAQTPGRSDGTAALQPTRSNGSTPSRPASGALSEALRSPRSRSAAIDVPTSPARALHARRLLPEQHHQEMPPQLPRPAVRPKAARTGAPVTPRGADATQGLSSGWARPERAPEGARAADGKTEGAVSGEITHAGRSDVQKTAAPERSVSETSTPRRKVEYSPRYQPPGANPFVPLPAQLPASEQAKSATASGRQAEADKVESTMSDAFGLSSADHAAAADAGLENATSGGGSAGRGEDRSQPRADLMGSGILTVAPEPLAYLQQEQPLQGEPPSSSMQLPVPHSAAAEQLPWTAVKSAEAQEQSSTVQAFPERLSVVPVVPRLAEQQMPIPPAANAATVPATIRGVYEPLRQLQLPSAGPEPQAAAQTDLLNHLQIAHEAPTAQQREDTFWFGGGGSQEVSAPQALFPEAADEDSFWLDQEEPGQGLPAREAVVDAPQEQAAHSLAAQAALLGRDPPTDAAPAPGTEQHMQGELSVPVSAAEPHSQAVHEEPHNAGAAEEADKRTGQEEAVAGSSQATAAGEPPAVSIPFAGGGASADLFPGSADLFGSAVGEEASFFEEFGSAAGMFNSCN